MRDRLQKLAHKWREDAKNQLPLISGLLTKCADELMEVLEIEETLRRR